jgi:hypothetical protein
MSQTADTEAPATDGPLWNAICSVANFARPRGRQIKSSRWLDDSVKVTLDAEFIGNEGTAAIDDGRLMGGRTVNGRFTAGHRFSRGKQPGERNRATLMAERLLSKDAAAAMRKIGAAAKAGEPWRSNLSASVSSR